MSSELRHRILLVLDAHSKTGSSKFKGDDELAAETGEPIGEIRSQLEILAAETLITFSRDLSGTCIARIKPKGTLLVEQLRQLPKPPIGFRHGE